MISGEREVARSESEEEDGRWHDDDDRETLEGVPRVLTVVITPPYTWTGLYAKFL